MTKLFKYSEQTIAWLARIDELRANLHIRPALLMCLRCKLTHRVAHPQLVIKCGVCHHVTHYAPLVLFFLWSSLTQWHKEQRYGYAWPKEEALFRYALNGPRLDSAHVVSLTTTTGVVNLTELPYSFPVDEHRWRRP